MISENFLGIGLGRIYVFLVYQSIHWQVKIFFLGYLGIIKLHMYVVCLSLVHRYRY